MRRRFFRQHLLDAVLFYSIRVGEVKYIDIKNRAYYFFDDMINIEVFDSNLLKIDKGRTKALVFTTLDTLQLKNLMIIKIFTVKILCI